MKKTGYAAAVIVLTLLICAAALIYRSASEPVSVRAVIVSRLEDGRTIAPYSSVRQDDDEKEYVYVWTDGAAVKRYILPLSECSVGFVLSEGLESGEVLILEPDEIAGDGQRVQIDRG